MGGTVALFIYSSPKAYAIISLSLTSGWIVMTVYNILTVSFLCCKYLPRYAWSVFRKRQGAVSCGGPIGRFWVYSKQPDCIYLQQDQTFDYQIFLTHQILALVTYIHTYIHTFVTSHGKTKSYLHRFKIIESPDCPCGGGSQTVDHLIFECTILQNERERLISKISRYDNWPVNKSQLGNKYIKQFLQFTNTVDFAKLWAYKPSEISAYKLSANKCI
jgi:hypothetical protein